MEQTMESKIVFEVGDETIVRHGYVPTSQMISDATKEFGEIVVVESTEGSYNAPDPKPNHKNILEATKFNLQTSYDQLASLNEDYPMRDAKAHIASAIALVEAEIETLG